MTESGIVTSLKLLQLENAELPILVTESGIVTPVKLLQPMNAELPILVTESGIVTPVKLLQLENASCPIFSPLVIVTALRLFFGILVIAKVGIVACSIGQPENALLPILVTEFPIVTSLKLLHL